MLIRDYSMFRRLEANRVMRRMNHGRHVAALVFGIVVCCGVLVDRSSAIDVHTAQKPVFVDVDARTMRQAMSSDIALARQAVVRAAGQIARASDANPNRLITLRVHGLQAASHTIGHLEEASDMAESLAMMLDVARAHRPSAKLTVYGLPVEGHGAATKAFGSVIERLDAFVVPKSFILSASGAGESTSIQQSLQMSTELAGDRPVVFKTNGVWRMATDVSPNVGSHAPAESSPSQGSSQMATTDGGFDASDGLTQPAGDWQIDMPQALTSGQQEDIAMLLASWGKADGAWDLNGDGTVGPADLAILLGTPSESDTPSGDDADDPWWGSEIVQGQSDQEGQVGEGPIVTNPLYLAEVQVAGDVQIASSAIPGGHEMPGDGDCGQPQSPGEDGGSDDPITTPTSSFDPTWAQLQPSPDSKLVYVSSSVGSDAASGAPTSPVKTLQKAYDMIRDDYPDWILLKRGDVWSGEQFPTWKKAGRSSDEPLVIGSYGPSGALPRVNSNGSDVFNLHTSSPLDHIVIRDLHLTPEPRDPSDTPTGIRMVGGGSNVTIEGCRVEGFRNNIVIQSYGGGDFHNVVVRNNVVADSYSTSSHSQGIFTAGVHGLEIEGNVFDHNGWHESIAGAEATIFNHNVYVDVSCTDLVVRHNILARAASHGLQARPGGIVEDNLLIRNGLALSYGVVRGTSSSPLPGGVVGSLSNNVVIEARDITDDTPRGYGFEIGNIKDGANVQVANNILAHDQPASGTGCGLLLDAEIGVGIHDMIMSNNIVYDWRSAVRLKGDVGTLVTDLLMKDSMIQALDDGSPIFKCFDDVDPAEFEFSNNAYHSNRDDTMWFKVDQSYLAFEGWEEFISEVASDAVEISFVDPDRSIGEYHSLTGHQDSTEAFLQSARSQSRYEWNDAYTASAVSAFIREGFVVE